MTATTPATSGTSELVRRSLSPYRTGRPTAYYAPASGSIACENPAIYPPTGKTESASALLDWLDTLPHTLRPRIVFVCGPCPDVAWWHAPIASGWSLDRWYNAVDHRTGVYSRGDVTIDLRHVAPWFGSDEIVADPAACLDARSELLRALRRGFGPDARLMNTPGMTGSELLEAALPAALRIPTLPAALREQIRSFTTQGRRELFMPPETGATIPETTGATLVDAIWQYAACLHHLPVGRVQRDKRDVYAGYTPGFYRVTAHVPRGWSHVGLLPHRDADGTTVYPAWPGMTLETWVTGAELDLALNPKWGHNWQVRIGERILWPDANQSADPLKTWILQLRAARAALLQRNTAVSRLAAGAVRHLVIDTVGRWYSVAREEWGVVPLARIGDLPPGAIPHIIQTSAPAVSYMLPAQHQPALERFAHPEWAATVWGRSRARTTALMLRLPRETLLRVHTDGVWTTADAATLAGLGIPRDPDEPAALPPGSWRIKATRPGPLAWPEQESDYWTWES